MTGRELIIFIVTNHLEDEYIIENGVFPGFITVEEAAVMWHTGRAIIKGLYKRNKVKGLVVDGEIYIYKNQSNPFKD